MDRAYGRCAWFGLAVALGCGSNTEVLHGPVPDAQVALDAAVSSGPRGDAAAGGRVDGGGRTAEICDGLDNDGNGIIDDVDAQGDGVCDCLNIATIGEIGPWSDGGNVFKSWLNSRSPTPAKELGDDTLTDDLLAPYQVIVVLHVATFELRGNGRTLPAHHAFSDDEVATFERWVRAGGGVMTTIGYTADEAREVDNVNRLLAPFAMKYSDEKLGVDGYVEDWVAHPLTEGVQKIFTHDGVEPDGAAGMTLARDSDRHVVLQARTVDRGHVVVWGDEWITYDSQWRDAADQQVERLWLNTLKWLSPAQVCQVPIAPE